MNNISHMKDENDNVIIEATIDSNTYAAVLIPKIINGISYIKESSINTTGCDNPQSIKREIIDYITTNRGKQNEAPIVVERIKEDEYEL